jgi:pilus assembly protein Flp/PilA
MRKLFRAFVRDERGVSAMEYAVLAGIVVVALGGMATAFKGSITGMFNDLFTKVTAAQDKAN